MSTEFLGLSLTDASETSMKFLDWRQSIDGVGVNSNMELIDAAIKNINVMIGTLNTTVGGKADGLTLDPATGILQLTSDGVAIEGASVTIDLTKYYTAEQVNEIVKTLQSAIALKADGFTLDPDTGVLQLTSNGTPLEGAFVTINLNQYYTKEETNDLLADLEASVANNETIIDIQSRSLGDLTWDEANRALTMYNLNGEVVGNPLIIEGGGGTGSSDAYSVRLVSGMSAASFTVASSAQTNLTATYYEYYGQELTGVSGSLDVEYKLSTLADEDANWTSFTTMSIEQGVPFVLNVTDILTLGATTNVRLTVTGGESDLARSLTYNITQVEASIADVNFDSSATYTGNIAFEYICVGRNLAKVVHFAMDGTEFATVDVGTSHNSKLSQSITMTGVYEYGAHRLNVWFTTSDGASSNILEYAILFDDGSKQSPIIGLTAANRMITYGDNLIVNYVVDTPGQETTDELNIRVYEEDSEGVQVNYYQTALVDVPNNTIKPWQCSIYPPVGTAHIEFESGGTVAVVSIEVQEIETEYDLSPIATGLVYSYSSSGRSNNDSDRDLYKCEYTTVNDVVTNICGSFNSFNWVSNGYIDGKSLTISGGATHTIEFPMFSTSYIDADGQTINLESDSEATVTKKGRTFEVEFMVSNVTDINAHIIECMSSDHAGFVVTPQNCWLLSSNGSNVVLDDTGFIENEESIAAAYIKDGVRLRLSFVIEALGTVQYTLDDGTAMSGQCVDIYINGQFANSFVYPSTARFASSEYITMGNETCIMNLYDVRIYNRGLSATEIMQNYCASPLSVQDRLVRFEDNDVLTDDGDNSDVDYFEAIKKYNCLLVTGPLSPYKGADGPQSGRDGKYECGLTLTKPNGEGGYTTEFELLDKDDNGVWLCSNNVQGTSSQKFPVKNYKVYLMKSVENDDGTVGSKKVEYALKGQDANGNDLSIGESTLCWKADYMSSDHANTFNANLADTLFTDKTPAQEENPLVQNTVYGFRCLLFQRDDENGEIRFAGDGALNNDKGNSKSFGLEDDSDDGNDTKCQKWEFLNNTEALCSFLSDRLYETIQTEDGEKLRVTQGLESCYPDQGDLEDEGLSPNYDHIQTLFTWVCQRANFWDASTEVLETPMTYNGAKYTTERDYRKAIFVNEFDKHFNRNHALVYYLFMEFVALCDNRAKNMFLQSFDVRAESLLDVNGEAMSINDAIDNSTGVVDADMIDWENSTFAVWYPVLYDLDSCFGVENSGYMQIPYYADWNYRLNDTQKFNGRESVLWLMFEEAMASDIMAEAKTLTDRSTGNGALNYDNLYDIHIRNNAELVCPAIVNRDMTYKYNDPWINGFINYSLDVPTKQYISDYKYMQRGSRTQQKDAFIYRRFNMLYSKYKCNKFLNNNINFRCGTDGGVAAANSDITILANQTLYPAVKYGDGDAAVISGAKTAAGDACVITKPGTGDGDKVGFSDTIYIAGGTFLTDIGDISKFCPYEIQLQNASGLRKLILGSDGDYKNPQLKNVDASGCKLLEEINIMGCTSLTTVDLSYNGLLKKVYAGNSSATAISLPNGGVLEELYLGSVSDLVVLNQSKLTAFNCDSFDSISQLWVENTPVVPTLEIVIERLPYLTGGLRLIGVDWEVDDVEILERLIGSEAQGKYLNNNGVLSENKTAYPQITGTVKCGSIGSYVLEQLSNIYPDLIIEADNIVQQYVVEFQNWDGTVLDTQMVYRGSSAIDPVTREDNPIDTPTRPSTVSTDYTYAGWDVAFTVITGDTVVVATYSETTRSYTVRWYNGSALLWTQTAEYGTGVEYEGDTPINTSQEEYLLYSIFDGWSHNTSFVDGDVDVYAKFTDPVPAPTDKTLSEMTPTELYALVKTEVLSSAGTNNTVIVSGDTIDVVMGHDFDFEGIDSTELISVDSPMVFDGTNYLDTGITLFDEDKAFVLAIDFAFSSADATTMLAACYDGSGFALKYSSNPVLQWGSSKNVAVASELTREMVVVRKKAGDSNLYVYASNRAGSEIISTPLANTLTTQHSAPLSFGANVQADGYVDSYGKGTVYWSKIWMADLGDNACQKLASWTRNTVTFQAAGNSEYMFRLFKRADMVNRYVNCCFLMENLLDITIPIRDEDKTNNNGGWVETYLRKWANSRFLNALPDQWQLLALQIVNRSSMGGQDPTQNECVDRIFAPHVKLLGLLEDTEPYANEIETACNLFKYNPDRIKYLANGAGDASIYATASPYYSDNSSEATLASTYFYSINATGKSAFLYPTTPAGVCLGFCI